VATRTALASQLEALDELIKAQLEETQKARQQVEDREKELEGFRAGVDEAAADQGAAEDAREVAEARLSVAEDEAKIRRAAHLEALEKARLVERELAEAQKVADEQSKATDTLAREEEAATAALDEVIDREFEAHRAFAVAEKAREEFSRHLEDHLTRRAQLEQELTDLTATMPEKDDGFDGSAEREVGDSWILSANELPEKSEGRASRMPSFAPESPSALPEPEVRAVSVLPAAIQRVRRRIELRIEVTFDSEHTFYTGFTENVSSGGLFVCTHEVHDLGDSVWLSFTIPSQRKPIETEGKVRWVRDVDALTDEEMPGMGIEFCELDPAIEKAIDDFIQVKGSLFFLTD